MRPEWYSPLLLLSERGSDRLASERVALMTIFNQPIDAVQELKPGTATVIKHNGRIYRDRCRPQPYTPCSFERIYFSRGNDADIYKERQALGGA